MRRLCLPSLFCYNPPTSMNTLDICAIVASNPSQASAFRALIAARKDSGLYPREIEFVVRSDPENGRVGSGGGTILAVDALREPLSKGSRILLIHAGGESRRMPTYAAEGKLFAPVPVRSSSRLPPVLLDLQLSLFQKYPWNEGELIVSSGDVAIDFETELVPPERGDIYGFAKPASFEEGSRHGVFKFDRRGIRVVDFFQKESPEFLRENAALLDSRSCGLDTGIVGFSPAGVETLLRLAEQRVASEARMLDALREGAFRVDLYREILIACVAGGTFEGFLARLGRQSAAREAELRSIFEVLHALELQAFVTRRPRFLHFGSLPEYAQSSVQLVIDDSLPFYATEDAELRPVMTESVLQHNSRSCICVPAEGALGIYVEGCEKVTLGGARGRNLFVGLSQRHFPGPIPSGICLDERHSALGDFLLAYGTEDTWGVVSGVHELRFCNTPLVEWLGSRGLEPQAVFPKGMESVGDLYNAALFLRGADEAFTSGYWDPAAAGKEWRGRFAEGPRFTLREISSHDSPLSRETRRCEIRTRILKDEILDSRGWLAIPEADFLETFSPSDSGVLTALSERTDNDLVRIYRSRLLCSLRSEPSGMDTIRSLRVDYMASKPSTADLRCGVKRDQIVWARSPVRLDLAGGWTDTPPFTLREGGEVVNVAVNLNDQPPIQVFCRRTDERSIKVHSIDTGVGELIESFEALEGFDQPGSSFALPKAALVLLGLTRAQTGAGTLGQALERIGCGMELTLLSAVPKGSGLGTSSILGGTILAALQRFFGLPVLQDELFRMVLQMEQMLTTGGGWQDQIGGIAGGVKYIESRPGLRPDPVVYQLDPFLFQDQHASSRFTLYYTGATRLAKNILQEVVDRVNSMEPAYLYTLRSLKVIARKARESISLRDLRAIGQVMNASWEANKRIHESTTNREVESLLASVRGRYSGMKLLGAGGGGFILFLSDSLDDADALRERLEQGESERARVVGMRLNTSGLEVTVS